MYEKEYVKTFMRVKISIIVPVHNEKFSIRPLYLSLQRSIGAIGQAYEVIFIDDCSTDGSLDELAGLCLEDRNLTAISLSRRYGQSLAIQAGLDIAGGDLIVTIDGDLQNDPADIPKLLNKMNDGFDMVCGWRHKRNDPYNKILASKIACSVRRIITGEHIHDFGCSLRAFRKDITKGIYLSSGMHRFFTLIILRLGYKIGEIKVKHYHRRFGKSKYNINNRLCECLFDFIYILLFGIPKAIRAKPDYIISRIIRSKHYLPVRFLSTEKRPASGARRRFSLRDGGVIYCE